ncbi:MAG TPA: hypothetical protein PK760_15415, partial [Flavobacteriales bacterium]|nr:hypothetical protein [Flavobacteriales bacterium]
EFVIERGSSVDAFEPIGEVDASGNTWNETHYSWTDAQPLPGISYYRLRERDEDGTERVSAMVAVDLAINTSVTATSEGDGSWLLHGALEDSEWSVVDATGRVVANGVVTSRSATGFNVAIDANAVHVLRVNSAAGNTLLKLPPPTGDPMMITAKR